MPHGNVHRLTSDASFLSSKRRPNSDTTLRNAPRRPVRTYFPSPDSLDIGRAARTVQRGAAIPKHHPTSRSNAADSDWVRTRCSRTPDCPDLRHRARGSGTGARSVHSLRLYDYADAASVRSARGRLRGRKTRRCWSSASPGQRTRGLPCRISSPPPRARGALGAAPPRRVGDRGERPFDRARASGPLVPRRGRGEDEGRCGVIHAHRTWCQNARRCYSLWRHSRRGWCQEPRHHSRAGAGNDARITQSGARERPSRRRR